MVDVTGDGRLYSKRQVAVRAGSLLVYIEPKTKIRDSQAKLVHTMSLERVSVLPAVRVSQDGLFKLELKQVSGKKLNLQVNYLSLLFDEMLIQRTERNTTLDMYFEDKPFLLRSVP